MRKSAAFIFIIAGAATMLYPFVYREISSYQGRQLLEQWDQNQAGEAAKLTIAAKNYAKLTEVFANSTQKGARGKPDPEPGSLLGTIEIDRIDVRLPILEGATLDHLRIAAGHIIGTSFPGTVGNSAIAAHRSYTYGRMFNRLNEVEAGDKVVIETKKNTYIYTVYKKMFVEPTDLSVLKGDGRHRMLTLITCHPLGNPTGRLIVRAKINED